MKYYLRERFINPLESNYEPVKQNYYVVGTLEQPVALFSATQKALVKKIMESCRDAAIQHGHHPFELTWSSSSHERSAPLYAVVVTGDSTPPVVEFDVEAEI
ncbi:MAG: hypothetical protein JWQ02_1870 [Capsulimonas sp.]|jgi:hypothetical protein|nr:hypothetical protein [Capsulimonas sp.]